MAEVTAAVDDVQRDRHLRQRGQQDAGRERSRRRQPGEHRDLQRGGGSLPAAAPRRSLRSGRPWRTPALLWDDTYHIKRDAKAPVSAGLEPGHPRLPVSMMQIRGCPGRSPGMRRIIPASIKSGFPDQQACRPFAGSPTISGCRASETAGEARITSACAPKMRPRDRGRLPRHKIRRRWRRARSRAGARRSS